MKNASIRVNVEKQIPNVGLRLFSVSSFQRITLRLGQLQPEYNYQLVRAHTSGGTFYVAMPEGGLPGQAL